MESSLSALLPVHNAQATLAATVHEFLEILPEVTRDFELVIADDGSTDATIEVADELAVYYPQVSAVRHARRRGRVAAIRTALARSSGEIVLLRDDDCRLPLGEVHRLWRAAAQHEIVLGRLAPPAESKWPAWKRLDAGPSGGLQLLRRRVIGPISAALGHQTTLLATLTDQGYAWHEVEVAHPGPYRDARRLSALARRLLRRGGDQADQPAPTDPDSPAHHGPKRPNYLGKLRDFALGE